MSKKNTGTTLGVLVAVSVGATAYASAMNNLDKETYTKTLLENKVSYVEPAYKAKADTVKAEYTREVENTNVGESKEAVAVNESEKEASLYGLLNEEEVEATDDKDDLVEVKDEEVAEEEKEEVLAEETEKTTEEEKEESQVVEEYIEQEAQIIEEVIEEDESLAQSKEKLNNLDYEANNSVEVAEEETEVPVQEEKEEVSTYAEKFVAVEYLNVRKDPSTDSQIVTTIKAGDKLTGYISGEWLQTDMGYVKTQYLQDYYPQALVDELEAKKAQEEANRKAEEERKAKEEAQIKAEAEKKSQEEANRKAQEAKKGEEAKKSQAVAYTGWVNTSGLNIRSKASTSAKIIGSLVKGDKVSGTLENGWLSFNFNGQAGYVSGSYLVNYEVKKDPVVKQEVPQKQEDQQVSQTQVTQQTVSGNGQSAANIAQQFAGYPYVFGASDPSVGFDCSGLVHYAYRQVGINLSRNSAAQFSNGYAVDSGNLVPGDLVFFSYGGGAIDHVGIITGYDGTFIHASTPGTGVVYGNIYSSHYQSVFRGARRIF